MKPSLAALAFGVLFSGCSARVPEPAPAPTPARPLAVVAPAPVREPTARPDPIATYSYNPIGRRDPFRVELEPAPAPVPVSNCNETFEPLCRYSLDELKLTGIVSGMGNPVAVIESPRGKGYSAYRGSRIGKHGGVVKQVLRDAVVVVESWPDSQGLTREQETVLRMRADAPLELGE